MCVDSSYPYKWMVRFSVSIITTHLWDSNYSEYQEVSQPIIEVITS